MTHMLHCMDKNCGDKSGKEIQLMQNKTIKCWPCQEESHKANECPNHEKNEKLESELAKAKVKWSVSSKQILNGNASGAFDRSVLDK